MSSLALIAPALYNRYPLLYFDSGAYIEMSEILEPSFHRAFGYPLLMKMTGMVVSNWPIIFIQGILLSVLLYRILRGVFPAERLWWKHALTVLILSFASAMPWYAAQLMPDVWTLILVSSLGALLLERSSSRVWFISYGLIITAALLTHLSHIPLLILLILSLVALRFALKSTWIDLGMKHWVSMALPFVAAFLITCSFNAAYGMGFRLSLATNAFVTANLGEMGILKFYLDEQCGEIETDLCDLKDNLPLETYGYLWDPNGPVQQHPGGWAGANEEYSVIVKDFLTQPRYMKWLIIASVKATVKQMFQIEVGSGLQYAYGEGTPPYGPMKNHYKQELNEYLTAVQNKGDDLPLDFFRWVNYLSLFLGLGVITWAILQQRLTPELGLLLIVFLLAYFFNAAITGVLANVYERLQVRLLPWVQLMAVLIALKEGWFGKNGNST